MFGRGDHIFIPGASGEPIALTRQVFGAGGVEVTTSFVPGLNPLRAEDMGEGSRVTGLFMQPGLAEAQRQGRFRHLPFSYAAMQKHIVEGRAFDACVVQIAPPDEAGRCSLGPAAEFLPAVLEKARRIVAVINPHVPRIPHAPWILRDRIDSVVESDAPLVTYDVGTVDDATRRIAQHVARLVRDGAAIQVGLGKVPHALMEALHGHRGLRIHSGMISDGVMGLFASGALDPDWTHRTTSVLGSAALYEWARGNDAITVSGVGDIHTLGALAGVEGLVAVNSALEVDLFGQCNLELAKGRAVSGGGGATDFARGARLVRGGISVVALPATFGGGKGSRILARLGPDGLATLPRVDVDVIVTEEGVADLRGLSVHERAEAIIGIAAPDCRAALLDQWQVIVDRL